MRDSQKKLPKIRVGIAGLGRQAHATHLPALKNLEDKFEVVGLCDILRERREIAAKAFFPNAVQYRRVDDMSQNPGIDVVVISTPTTEHASDAAIALESGKVVIIEPPSVLNVDDANNLKAIAARTRGRILVANHSAFAPEFLLARSMLEDTRLGSIYDVSINAGTFVRRCDWQTVGASGGGAINYACHDYIFPARILLNAKPIRMWCETKRLCSAGDVEDYVKIIFQSEGLSSCSLVFSGAEVPPSAEGITVRGINGRFFAPAGSTKGTLTIVNPDPKQKRLRASVRTPPLVESRSPLKFSDIPISLPNGTPYGTEGLWCAVESSIRNGVRFPVEINQAIDIIRLMQVVHKSTSVAV